MPIKVKEDGDEFSVYSYLCDRCRHGSFSIIIEDTFTCRCPSPGCESKSFQPTKSEHRLDFRCRKCSLRRTIRAIVKHTAKVENNNHYGGKGVIIRCNGRRPYLQECGEEYSYSDFKGQA